MGNEQTTKRTEILFIHHGIGLGGAVISLLNLVKQLDKNKYGCVVAFVKKGTVVQGLFEENGIETDVIDSSDCWFLHHQSGKIHWAFYYQYFKIFIHWLHTAFWVAPRYLRSREFDIVHLNSHVLTSWAFAAKRLGKVVVLHNREAIACGYFGFRRHILQRLIENNTDAVINISKDNAARLGIREKSLVIYNSVHIPKSCRLPMDPRVTKRKVLYLGGMASIKGYEDVVECLSYLDDDIVLQFAGNIGKLEMDSSFKGRLKNWIKLNFFGDSYKLLRKVKTSKNAELLGLLRNANEAIDKCDVLITPFRIEHFSRPAIEAFAFGKPVIGSNVAGMDEIIDDGVNGMLVQKSNPRALAEAINYLCKNPVLAQEMGKRGREKAWELFSAQSNTLKIEALYEGLVKGRCLAGAI